MILQDAYAEFRVADAFMLDAGLMFVPFSRNSLQSAATLLPIDYGAYTFSDSTPTESTTGRDTGFQARGYFAGNRLEYRIGVFQGARDADSDNAFRYTGRVQYNALDPESGFFYREPILARRRSSPSALRSTCRRTFTATTPMRSSTIHSGPAP